mmetsp:Transcript_7651/g.14216  ORF Transcript_7651/g.14216 Transcript_7651/m.14216 type:complete len:507 (+) Transcript_7651:167-1687(+)
MVCLLLFDCRWSYKGQPELVCIGVRHVSRHYPRVVTSTRASCGYAREHSPTKGLLHLRDQVSEGDFLSPVLIFTTSRPQALDSHRFLLPFRRGDQHDVRRTCAVCIRERIPDFLLRFLHHVDREPSRAEHRGDGARSTKQLRIERGHNEVNLSLALLEDLVHQLQFLEQLHDDTVAKPKPATRHLLLRTVEAEQAVVSSAATDGAKLLLSIETLKDDAGVVGEPPYDRGVKDEEVSETVVLRVGEEGLHFIHGCHVDLALAQLCELFDRLAFHSPQDHLRTLHWHLFLCELGSDTFWADLVKLVDDHTHGCEHLLRHPSRFHYGAKDLSAVDLNANILPGDPDRLEEGRDCRQEFKLGGHTGHPNDVHVPLVVLSLAPALYGLKPPALGNGEPLEGEQLSDLAPLVHLLHDHSGKGGRHFGPERNLRALLVDEIVHLRGDLLARLTLVELGMLEHRRVVLLEGEGLRRFFHFLEEPLLHGVLFGEKVPCARGWFERDHRLLLLGLC